MCEYRFYLQEEYGQKATRASIEGVRLHDTTATSEIKLKKHHQIIPILIIIVTIIVGYMWIFG